MEKEVKDKKSHLIPIYIVVVGIIISVVVFLSQTESFIDRSQGIFKEFNIDIEGWPTMGSPEAPIIMVEYSDFNCPFSKKFKEEIFPLIKENYIDKGKLLFVYKDFPIVGGERAAEAVHCAGEQGKYWEYHNILYEYHDRDRENWHDFKIHKEYAEDLNLNIQPLVECFQDRRYQDKVEQSMLEASLNGFQGSPYFVINNQTIFGVKNYSRFEQVIESLLEDVEN